MSYSAMAVTDSLGRGLKMGMDFSTLSVAEIGERIDPWVREVSYKGTTTLGDLFTSDKFLKFDLLARIVQRTGKVDMTDEITLYASGYIKELRFGKKKYRAVNSSYLGNRSL